MVGIAFEIRKGEGESPYKIYVSSDEVSGSMFVIMSKLTREQYVQYELHKVTPTGSTMVDTKTVSSNDFYIIVKKLETALKASNPVVEMVEKPFENNPGIAKIATVNGRNIVSDEELERLADIVEMSIAQGVNPQQVPPLIMQVISENKAKIAEILAERTREALAGKRKGNNSPVDELRQMVAEAAEEMRSDIEKALKENKGASIQDIIREQINNTEVSARLKRYL